MNLKNYFTKSYPTVTPYEGVAGIEHILIEKQYVVVEDIENQYYGLLIPSDIIKHPHKLVIDCLTPKEVLQINDPMNIILSKFYSSHACVLPVFEREKIIGIIEKKDLINDLEEKFKELYKKSLISKKTRDFFIENLYHEIRTPLNGFLGFLDLISQFIEEDEDFNPMITNYIKSSADHFLMIVNDLVELSILQSGEEIQINYEKTDIVKLINELNAHLIQIFIKNKLNFEIEFVNKESSFFINTDVNKFRTVLFHILHNAVKFSANQKVIVGFNENMDNNQIDFFVKNKIKNFETIELTKMFELFDKQDTIGDDLNSGLGIGLPLVKLIIEKINGTISFETFNDELITTISIFKN
jgi:signal transduction histidine kinase